LQVLESASHSAKKEIIAVVAGASHELAVVFWLHPLTGFGVQYRENEKRLERFRINALFRHYPLTSLADGPNGTNRQKYDGVDQC
jgi:hypothetical protein